MNVILVNGAVAGIGALLALLINKGVAYGFIIGYIVGVLNGVWLFKAVARGARLSPAKARIYVAAHYYARFIVTAAIFTVFIYFRLLNPWSPVIGLTTAIFTMAAILIFYGREEVFK